MARPKEPKEPKVPDPNPGHGHDNNEAAEVRQLRRIADELEKVTKKLDCICDALQPPSAQSATLVINQIIKGIKESQ